MKWSIFGGVLLLDTPPPNSSSSNSTSCAVRAAAFCSLKFYLYDVINIGLGEL